jgi:hypothetical protein
MRLSRLFRLGFAVLIVIIGVPLVYYFLILDWQGRPRCHKVMMLGFDIWMTNQGMDPNAKTNTFPNVNGASRDSLMAIGDQIGGLESAKHYRYVPGLRQDDPCELVLMYFDRPTRWMWHGHPPTIFQKRAWIIVPVDFASESRKPVGPGELSERVSIDELRNRLTRTLDYIRTHERPHWQAVVAEHTKFLKSIELGP